MFEGFGVFEVFEGFEVFEVFEEFEGFEVFEGFERFVSSSASTTKRKPTVFQRRCSQMKKEGHKSDAVRHSYGASVKTSI